MLFDGRCDVSKCTFQHDTATLRALAETLHAKLIVRQRELKDAANTNEAVPKTTYPSRPPPKPPYSFLHNCNILLKNFLFTICKLYTISVVFNSFSNVASNENEQHFWIVNGEKYAPPKNYGHQHTSMMLKLKHG
jgi:hypothetical protein